MIEILAFGAVREIVGGSSVTIHFNDTATVAEIKALLEEQYPGLKKLTSFMIAVNGEYANITAIIKQGDEVAIIPPVSGG